MGGKPNPKSNPIGFGALNPKTVGEKSSPNPNPREPKSADIQPEIAPLPSFFPEVGEVPCPRMYE